MKVLFVILFLVPALDLLAGKPARRSPPSFSPQQSYEFGQQIGDNSDPVCSFMFIVFLFIAACLPGGICHDEEQWKKKFSRHAIASLACGILGLLYLPPFISLVGIVFGVVAIRKIRESEETLKGYIFVAVGICAAFLSFLIYKYELKLAEQAEEMREWNQEIDNSKRLEEQKKRNFLEKIQKERLKKEQQAKERYDQLKPFVPSGTYLTFIRKDGGIKYYRFGGFDVSEYKNYEYPYTQAMNGPWPFRWYRVDDRRDFTSPHGSGSFWLQEETYPGLSESWSIIEPSINSNIANRNHLITCSMKHSSTDVGALYFKKDGPRLYLVGKVPKFEEKEEFKIPPRERWVPLLSVEEWNPLRSGKYYYQRQDRNYEVYDFWDGDQPQAGIHKGGKMTWKLCTKSGLKTSFTAGAAKGILSRSYGTGYWAYISPVLIKTQFLAEKRGGGGFGKKGKRIIQYFYINSNHNINLVGQTADNGLLGELIKKTGEMYPKDRWIKLQKLE